MEVFLQELPPGLTNRSLRNELDHWMGQLSITAYSCSIHKNKKTGKIVFLDASNGRKFLERHGGKGLILMGTVTNCSRSRNKPSDFELRNIHYESEKRDAEDRHAPRQERRPITLAPQELSCGHIAFPDRKGFTFVSGWTHTEQYAAKFTRRNLILTLESSPKTEIRFPLQTVHELVWDERGRIALILTEPPVFLHPPDEGVESQFRGLSLHPRRGPPPPKERIAGIDAAHGQIVRYCLVYYMSVPGMTIGGFGRSTFLSDIQRLQDEDLLHVTRSAINHDTAGAAGSRFKGYVDSVAALEAELGRYNQLGSLPFTMLFLLKALVTNNYLHPTLVSELARQLVSEFSVSDWKKAGAKPPISIEAFKKLFQVIDYPSPDSDPSHFAVLNIMAYLRETEASMVANIALRNSLTSTESLIPILRATVTPTRVTLHGPEMEPPNRVLRKYPDHTDYFLRVQFCDESGSDLFFSAGVSLDAIYDRFKKVLSSGIQVAGRVYAFLGFSHSSLRAHSAWLSAPFVYETQAHFAKMIIRSLGDFDVIRSPARRAARIGQAFSETPWSLPLKDRGIEVQQIPDVCRNGRVFSDGVGLISWDAVQEVLDILPPSKRDATAFQVRWAGAKGMLALDARSTGREILVRESMVKFESQDTQALEICDVAGRPIRMVLNRSMVKILEDMGAPWSWFLKLQGRELKRLRLVTSEVSNTAAFLDHQCVGEAVKLGSFLKHLERMDLDYKEDNFLRSAVEAVVLQELRLLKYKARILVPKGITLFGIMDETGYLNEGEVYVTYTQGRHAKPPGAVPLLVTRSPALHPGDIQRATNVVPPANHPLAEHRNCIVFSKWGERDFPSQLSGGDLDGDLFNVIWDPEVVNHTWSFEPADYPRTSPFVLDEEITSTHMANFFIDFMKNDNLGLIANRHLMLADQRERGTLDEDCLLLAQLHSTAVDFSKTGLPVELRELPKADRTRPDFMAPGPWVKILDKSDIEMDKFLVQDDDDEDAEGPRYTYYKSDKVLGELYRTVDERKIWEEDIKWRKRPDGQDFWKEVILNLQYEARRAGFQLHSEVKVTEAERIRITYEDAVCESMSRWSDNPVRPLSELEVFLGFILNKTGSQTNRQRDCSIKLREEFERVAVAITRQLRRASRENPGPEGRAEALSLCLAGVEAANYPLGSVPSWRYKQNMVLESFRVVAASAFLRELGGVGAGPQGGGYVGVGSGRQ